MRYVEKYDLYIDDDLVVYRFAKRTNKNNVAGHLCQVKFFLDKYGYLKTSYGMDGKTKNVTLHKVIAEAFIPNPENKPTVDHINRNKLDNRIKNLRWATLSEQEGNKKRTIESRELHEGLNSKGENKNEWRRIQYRLTIERKRELEHLRYLRDKKKRLASSKLFYKKKSLTHVRKKTQDGKMIWVKKLEAFA